MKAYTTFVRAYGVVVLYTVAHVVADTPAVIDPGHAECVDSVWNAETFQKVHSLEGGVL